MQFGVGGGAGPGCPSCVMLNVRFPIEIDPVRPPALPFAATRYEMVPLPSPLALDVIVIHESLIVAVHGHPDRTVTAMVPVVPDAGTVCDEGEISNRQGAGSWETRTRLSLTTMSASRRDAVVLAPARNANEPLPWPDAGASSLIQFACVETVHAHSGCAVTDTVLVPPAAAIAAGVESVRPHLAGSGPVETLDEDSHPAASRASAVVVAAANSRVKQRARIVRIRPSTGVPDPRGLHTPRQSAHRSDVQRSLRMKRESAAARRKTFHTAAVDLHATPRLGRWMSGPVLLASDDCRSTRRAKSSL